jgi:hypothetical protein
VILQTQVKNLGCPYDGQTPLHRLPLADFAPSYAANPGRGDNTSLRGADSGLSGDTKKYGHEIRPIVGLS